MTDWDGETQEILKRQLHHVLSNLSANVYTVDDIVSVLESDAKHVGQFSIDIRSDDGLSNVQRLKSLIVKAVDEFEKRQRIKRSEAEGKWTEDLVQYSFPNTKELYVDSDFYNDKGGRGLLNVGKERYNKIKSKSKLSLTGKKHFTPIEVEALYRIIQSIPYGKIKKSDFPAMIQQIIEKG